MWSLNFYTKQLSYHSQVTESSKSICQKAHRIYLYITVPLSQDKLRCAESVACFPLKHQHLHSTFTTVSLSLNRTCKCMEWSLYWKRINPMVKHSLSFMELHTPSLGSTLSQLKPVDTHTPCLFQVHFHILRYWSTTFPFSFQTTILYTFSSLRVRNMTRTSFNLEWRLRKFS
jgi:hypothetical protein